MLNRTNLSLEDHLSNIGDLLTTSAHLSDSSFYERLLFYSLVACRQKLVCRIRHPILSKPYMQSLGAIGLKVNFQDHLAGQPKPAVNLDERKHDIKFLQNLLLAKSIKDSKIKIVAPRLSKLAEVVANDDDHPFELYTPETCQEFHDIFVAALVNFEDDLVKLSMLPSFEKGAVKDLLYSIFTHGVLLLKISLGSAIVQHLKSIEAALHTYHNHEPSGNSVPNEDDLDLLDEDLMAVQSNVVDEKGVIRPLWKCCIDWLRLILSVFESVESLIAYAISRPNLRIVMRLVNSPEDPALDRQLLPWKELLSDRKLFPTEAPGGGSPNLAEKANAELIDFITNSISRVPAIPAKGHDKISSATTETVLRKICQRLAVNALVSKPKIAAGSPLYPFTETSMAILEKILPNLALINPTVVQKIALNKNYNCALVPAAIRGLGETNKLLQKLDDTTRFFNYLKTMDNNFLGALHCETNLASLATSSVNREHSRILKDLAVRDHLYLFNQLATILTCGIGMRTSYRCFQALLPSLLPFALSSGTWPRWGSGKRFHRQRLSHHCFTMHLAHMAPKAHCGGYEQEIWDSVASRNSKAYGCFRRLSEAQLVLGFWRPIILRQLQRTTSCYQISYLR